MKSNNKKHKTQKEREKKEFNLNVKAQKFVCSFVRSPISGTFYYLNTPQNVATFR